MFKRLPSKILKRFYSTDIKKSKVIIIGGPTASGKSAFCNQLKDRLNGVIINCDSTKIYKDLNIGTNKYPNFKLSDDIRLIDIVDMKCDYNAGEFFKDARNEISNVLNEGKVPILVGGSGMYVRWIIHGKQLCPVRDTEISDKIKKEISLLQWDEVVEVVTQYDKDYAKKINQNDYRRAIRAIEIGMRTGKPISYFNNQNLIKKEGSKATADDFRHHDYDFRCFVPTMDRIKLYDKISNRCEDMIKNGLIEEVWSLMKRGLTTDYNAGKSIGYKQTIEFLEKDNFTESSFLEYLNEMKSKSRQLAHRQLSWFRSEPIFYWINTEEKNFVDEVIKCYDMDFESFHEYRRKNYETSNDHAPITENKKRFNQYIPPHYIYTAERVSKSQLKNGLSNQQVINAKLEIKEQLRRIKYLKEQV